MSNDEMRFKVKETYDIAVHQLNAIKSCTSMMLKYSECSPDEASLYYGTLGGLIENWETLSSTMYDLMNSGEQWKCAYDFLMETGRDYFTNEVIFKK